MRSSIVAAAVSGIGNAATDAIWLEVLPPEGWRPGIDKAWCGAFALACLRRALGITVYWQWGYGFLEVNHCQIVRMPEPGDIAYYDHPYQHHAVVECVVGDKVHTIDGNQGNGMDPLTGKIGTTVRRVVRALSAGVYYSIGQWLPKTEPSPPPGPTIGEIQHALNLAMNPGDTLLTVNGAIDDPTRTALYWYQRLHDIPITGEPDDDTLKALGL